MNITIKDIDWKSLLIKKYLRYDLNELDCMVIFVADAVLDMQPKTLLTCDILSPYMKASKDDIDTSLSKLMSKKYITIEQEGMNFYSTLNSFFQLLFHDEIKDLSLKGSYQSKDSLIAENLYSYLEDLGGQLSPIEKDRVTNWLKEGADEDMIKEACRKSVTSSGHISFKKADEIVLQLERSASRKNIGVSTVDETDRKNDTLKRVIDGSSWGVSDD